MKTTMTRPATASLFSANTRTIWMPMPPPEAASPPSGMASTGESASNPIGTGVAWASVPKTGSSLKASAISERLRT